MPPLPIIYVYPGCSYGSDASRQSGLTRALANLTRVVFLEYAPPTRHLGRPAFPGIRCRERNLTVVENAMGLGVNRYMRRLGHAARRVDRYQLRHLLRQLGITDYILWLPVVYPEIMEVLPTDKLVYDCMDPCFVADQQELYDAREAQIVSRATTVFATSQTLLDRMQMNHPRAYLLNNAADPELYAHRASAEIAVPEPLRGRSRPIVGYLGTTDWRVDTDSLLAAATALSEYTFCIAGRVNADQIAKTRALAALPNVVMPGSVPVDEGPAYNAAFDVGLVPYLPGDIGDAINPVKMYMYLSMGKPVVSTWIRECRDAAPYVTATRDVGELVEAIRVAAAKSNDHELVKVRLAFARRNTWDDRARQALAVLADAP